MSILNLTITERGPNQNGFFTLEAHDSFGNSFQINVASRPWISAYNPRVNTVQLHAAPADCNAIWNNSQHGAVHTMEYGSPVWQDVCVVLAYTYAKEQTIHFTP